MFETTNQLCCGVITSHQPPWMGLVFGLTCPSISIRIGFQLVGGIPTPLRIWVSQLGWWHSRYMESHKIHVPNHQSVNHVYLSPTLFCSMFCPFVCDLRLQSNRELYCNDTKLLSWENLFKTWLHIYAYHFP